MYGTPKLSDGKEKKHLIHHRHYILLTFDYMLYSVHYIMRNFHYTMRKHLYIMVDLHYMMSKHLYIIVDLIYYMLIQPHYSLLAGVSIFCLRVCQVVFLEVLPFSPTY